MASEIGTLNGYAYVTPFDRVHHMAFVYGEIGDGKDVPARLHRADVISDVFGGAKPIHAALKRFKAAGRGVIVFLRDGTAGVPWRKSRTKATPAPTPRVRGSGARSDWARRSSRTSAFPRSGCSPPASALMSALAGSASKSPTRKPSRMTGLFLPRRRASIRLWGDIKIAYPSPVCSLRPLLRSPPTPRPIRALPTKSPSAIPVDVELVLAVFDVSYSMDPDEQALQREGYALALTSKEFMQALRQGANAKIAITYIEWAGQYDQKVIMPWRLIEGPDQPTASPPRSRPRLTGAPRAPRFRRLGLCQDAVRQQRLSRPAPRHRRLGRRRYTMPASR